METAGRSIRSCPQRILFAEQFFEGGISAVGAGMGAFRDTGHTGFSLLKAKMPCNHIAHFFPGIQVTIRSHNRKEAAVFVLFVVFSTVNA